jgi:hypothetical protein
MMPLETELLNALKEIAEGRGAFDRSPLVHYSNCIEEMQRIANAAIAKAERSTTPLAIHLAQRGRREA